MSSRTRCASVSDRVTHLVLVRPEPRYLRRRDAARFLGIAAATLRNWQYLGCGPECITVNGARLYEIRELVAFVDAHRLTIGAPASRGPQRMATA
jgi:hypothetical protein